MTGRKPLIARQPRNLKIYRVGGRVYCYHRATGRRLPMPSEPGFAQAYFEAEAGVFEDKFTAGERYEFERIQYRTMMRAKELGREYSLPDGWVLDTYRRQGGKCALTGTKMKLYPKREDRRNALQPSVDRIDNSIGYTPDNCRLTTVIANVARADFSDADFATLLGAARRRG